jgi:uncharacterized protein YndB with AHSA1/START domain
MNNQALDNLELVIHRIFDAPRELVFRMWTEQEHLTRWCCPKGFTITFSEGDIRSGGAFRTCMRSPEGEDNWLIGKYLELVAPEKIVFTHAWQDADGTSGPQTVVSISLSDNKGKTELTLHQARFTSQASRDGHAGGWNETLDNLDSHIAAVASRAPLAS